MKKKYPKQTRDGCMTCGKPFKINQKNGERIPHRHTFSYEIDTQGFKGVMGSRGR